MLLKKYNIANITAEEEKEIFEGNSLVLVYTGNIVGGGNLQYIVMRPESENTEKSEIENAFIMFNGWGNKSILYSTAITACLNPNLILSQTDISAKMYYSDNNTLMYNDINVTEYFSNIRMKLENIILEDIIDALPCRS
jgi:hypothetical protein